MKDKWSGGGACPGRVGNYLTGENVFINIPLSVTFPYYSVQTWRTSNKIIRN